MSAKNFYFTFFCMIFFYFPIDLVRHNKIMETKNFWERLKQKKLRLALAIVLLLGGIGLIFDKIFHIDTNKNEELVIVGHVFLKKEEILETMKITKNIRIRDMDFKDMTQRLLSHPRIKSAQIEKRSQNQVLVLITERKTNFLVNSNDALYEVDEEGRILSIDSVRDTSHCVISGSFSPEKGFFISKAYQDLSQSIRKMFKIYPELKERISEIQLLKTGGIIIYTFQPSRVRIIMGNSLDITQVRKLYASLAYFENEMVSAKLLDLRGDDAVFQ